MRQLDQRFQQVESQYNAGGDIHLYQPALSLTERQFKRNRALMLDRVQTTWIEGVLQPSLRGMTSLTLDLESKPSMTVTPFWQVLREFDQTMLLPQGLSTLVQVYDHAHGEVLILGEPGAGKTMLLLELTRDLLARARQDERQPMPVVFNLSSWALSRQPLAQWLATELHARYQIPLPLARSWLESDQVLPLLDGLDEVATAHREACVEAINVYRRAHGLLPTVVCCRKADYLALSIRLLLRTAVVVQPLTERQIASYLGGAGEETSILRRALREDAELRTLASTPLMLNVLAVAYREIPPEERTSMGSVEVKRERIFASYVQRMLDHRGAAFPCMQERTIWWLTTLARQMKKRGQTVFYIEQIQPDWLPGPRWHWIYDHLSVLLPGMLIGILMYLLIYSLLFSFYPTEGYLFFFILVGGLIGGLFSGSQRAKASQEREEAASRSKWHFLMPLCWGLFVGLGIVWKYDVWSGLAFGVSSTLLCFFCGRGERAGPEMVAQRGAWNNLWSRLVMAGHLRNGLLCVGLLGSSYLFHDSRHVPGGCSVRGFWMPDVFGRGVPDVLACGLISILVSIILLGGNRNIRPTEVIVWSWRSLGRGIFNKQLLIDGLLVGGVVGLGLGLSWGVEDGLHCGDQGYRLGFDWMKAFTTLESQSLSNWLSYALCYWLLIGLVQGVASNTLEERHRLMPNQGIRNSLRNGVMLGLISAMVGLFGYFLDNIGYMGSLMIVGESGDSGSWFCRLVTNSPHWLCQITSDDPINILFLLLGSGLLMGLLTGGLAYLRHMLLRLLLCRAGLMPWNYVRFLDAATSCIFLRKVGGGYIFLHRLLLDYFAALGPDNLTPIGPLPVSQGRQEQGPVPTAPDAHSSLPVEAATQEMLPGSSSSTLSDTTVISDRRCRLPCGHETRILSARFCSTCGAPVE